MCWFVFFFSLDSSTLFSIILFFLFRFFTRVQTFVQPTFTHKLGDHYPLITFTNYHSTEGKIVSSCVHFFLSRYLLCFDEWSVQILQIRLFFLSLFKFAFVKKKINTRDKKKLSCDDYVCDINDRRVSNFRVGIPKSVSAACAHDSLSMESYPKALFKARIIVWCLQSYRAESTQLLVSVSDFYFDLFLILDKIEFRCLIFTCFV